jgi:hypothetical protein
VVSVSLATLSVKVLLLLKTLGLLKHVLNSEHNFHFSYTDLDCPTSGLTVTRLARVYCISIFSLPASHRHHTATEHDKCTVNALHLCLGGSQSDCQARTSAIMSGVS